MKEGFKHTEVGLIPEDWDLVTYGDVFDFLTTATYSRAQLSENDEIGYVHYGDIHVRCTHFLDLDKIKLPTIKNDLIKNYPTLKDGDVIVVDASEDYEGVGKSVEVRNLKDRKVISGLHTFLLRDKEEKIANGFKGYIHSNRLVKKQMDTLATGLKVYGVSKNNLKKILIPLPPTKAEQTAIATVLSDADALIQKLEQLIAKKRNIKTGAMQELLKPKEGWVVKTISELGFIKSSSVDKLIRPNEKVVNLLNYMDVYRHSKISQKIIVGVTSASATQINSLNLLKGDVVFTPTSETADDIGHASLITSDLTDTVFSYHLTRLRFFVDDIVDELKPYIFNSKSLRDYFTMKATGSTRFVLKKSDFEEAPIHFPYSKTEQTRIAQILSDMDNEIQELEMQLEKFKMMKQGMMQSLLTGKIRLNCDS